MSAQVYAWVLLGNLNKILINVKTKETICLKTLRSIPSILHIVLWPSTVLRKEGFKLMLTEQVLLNKLERILMIMYTVLLLACFGLHPSSVM
jgi:hypothetical protein